MLRGVISLFWFAVQKGEAKTKEGASNGLGKAKAIYVRLSLLISERLIEFVCRFLDLGERVRSILFFTSFFPDLFQGMIHKSFPRCPYLERMNQPPHRPSLGSVGMGEKATRLSIPQTFFPSLATKRFVLSDFAEYPTIRGLMEMPILTIEGASH